MSLPVPMSFTVKSNIGLLHSIRTDVAVATSSNLIKVTALWDTGATSTCISKDVVTDLNLKPTGKMDITTPSGTAVVNTYLVDIVLPNAVTVKDVPVCDSEIGLQGLGVLIGMDIITSGDLAISNLNGQTVFSFRMPSCKTTDYVEEWKQEQSNNKQ